jgi:hypothetical protein
MFVNTGALIVRLFGHFPPTQLFSHGCFRMAKLRSGGGIGEHFQPAECHAAKEMTHFRGRSFRNRGTASAPNTNAQPASGTMGSAIREIRNRANSRHRAHPFRPTREYHHHQSLEPPGEMKVGTHALSNITIGGVKRTASLVRGFANTTTFSANEKQAARWRLDRPQETMACPTIRW